MPMRVVMGIAALHPSYGLPIPARLPRKAEAILFLHSTFVREEHPGRRLTLSAIGLYAGRVVARAAAKLPHWIGELSPPLNKWRSIMLRMMLLGLLIPLGVGVLAAMELKTPARNAVVVVQSPAETTVGISDSHRALAKADRLEIAAASSEAPAQPALAHDPEKWVPVFRKDHAQIKEIERDDDSKKRHHALIERISPSEGINIGPSEPPRVINRHRHEPKSRKITTPAAPKSKPKATDIKRTIISERRKAAGDTETCRLSAFGGLRKALNSVDCEI